MSTVLNNMLIQGAAITTIAVVTAFPSPEKLRYALAPDSQPVLEVSAPGFAEKITVTPAVYEGVVAEVFSPVRLDCISQEATDLSSLEGCASELNAFIIARETNLNAMGIADGLDFQIEQATLALTKLCRLHWATPETLTNAADRDACNARL